MSVYDEPYGDPHDATVRIDPARLVGSRDDSIGETYFPPRRYSVDGRLRELTTVDLSPSGVLYAWTSIGPQAFGQIDLPDGPRVQTELDGDDHEVGATYELVVERADGDRLTWKFSRA
jgi:uncharacterized OB-fold protein